jgi:GNAT superfamily N-acetyltransferase
MSFIIRAARRDDVPALVELLDAYMRETYNGAWGGNARQLERDALDRTFETFVAARADGRVVGFVAWISTYDLHWCLKGGEIIDFYVAPQNRGRGVGMLLAIELAAALQKRGGAFLKVGAVEKRAVRRFYKRIAMIFPNGECYISGRAFRHLAALSGKSVREAVKNLPEAAWNHEP